ncbi:MAG TPA: metalloregulator ArsR/SmtB family transcription factor [Thermoanaerobaculia bacterium]
MPEAAAAVTALDATFGALADPTRRAILARLAESPDVSVSELARPFAISLPAVSRHLRVLEGAGLLSRTRDGRVHHCRLEGRALRPAADWIAHYRKFWEQRLEALGRYLEETRHEEEEEEPWHPKRKTRPAKPKPRSASRAPSRPRARGSSGRGPTRSS